MQITASWGGADVVAEVGEGCRSLGTLTSALCSALPEGVDVEKVCLEVGGRAMGEEDVIALEEGSCVEVVPTRAAWALDTLRQEGHTLNSNLGLLTQWRPTMRVCVSCTSMLALSTTRRSPSPAARKASQCAPFSSTVEMM